jgi:hypothetical protein
VVVSALIFAVYAWRGLRERERVLSEVGDTSEIDALLAERPPAATPGEAARIGTWLRRARAVMASEPAHRARLAQLEAEAHGPLAANCAPLSGLPQLECRLRRDILSRLALLSLERVPRMEERFAFATMIARRSVDDVRPAWAAAIKSVSSPAQQSRSRAYRDAAVALSPQVGLVPLGADPASGLEEFAHLQSGEPAVRRDGRLEIGPLTGVVLVLLPGGTFQMGSKVGAAGSCPNCDPVAVASATPVNAVTLAPFFMAKYELTQAQYMRAAFHNPSAYTVGTTHAGRTISPMNPAEQMTWDEATDALGLVGLELPTEAQWEYAARGGTSSIWWWGDQAEAADLEGRANLADEGSMPVGPASWSYVPGLVDGHLLHAPVGNYQPNPFGIYDLPGNVWEWCRDGFAPYTAKVAPGDGMRSVVTADAAAVAHVFRGGGFRSSAVHLKSADRYQLYSAGYRSADVGVRAALGLHR